MESYWVYFKDETNELKLLIDASSPAAAIQIATKLAALCPICKWEFEIIYSTDR